MYVVAIYFGCCLLKKFSPYKVGYYDILRTPIYDIDQILTGELLETHFRGRIHVGGSIYYEFILQIERNPKLLKYATEIEHSSILRTRNRIQGYFASKNFI